MFRIVLNYQQHDPASYGRSVAKLILENHKFGFFANDSERFFRELKRPQTRSGSGFVGLSTFDLHFPKIIFYDFSWCSREFARVSFS